MVEGKETISKTLKKGRKNMAVNKCGWQEGQATIKSTQQRNLYEKLLQVQIVQVL